MKRALLIPGALALAGMLWFGTGTATKSADPTFPHARHQRLFPVCEGCHAGLLSGVAAETFPDSADCAQCHDGRRVERVTWTQRTARPSNLRFSHAGHREMSARAGEPAQCRSCHAAGGEPSRMNVDAADPAQCINCHEHRAETHLAGRTFCDRCHLTLASAASLPIERVARFPKPDWHLGDDYVSTHGNMAREVSCAVCHARETCERCHANAERVPEITALQRDPRVYVLELGRRPTYPLPASHNAEWKETHGARAVEDATRCANCHTPPSCTGCHPPQPGRASGVVVRSSVHTADMGTRHGTAAAAGRTECLRCHSNEACANCHAGSDSRAFHVADFVERHATDVFASGSDCQSCHNTETFCRSCHARAGVAAQPSMNAAFHNGQPMWVLTHGQAARTGMEACASCHRQNDCVRCHSATGGWGINPHGPDYAASRIAARNTTTCRWCHLSNPLGRNQ